MFILNVVYNDSLLKVVIGCFNGKDGCVNWEETEVYNLFQECPRQNKEKREEKRKKDSVMQYEAAVFQLWTNLSYWKTKKLACLHVDRRRENKKRRPNMGEGH